MNEIAAFAILGVPLLSFVSSGMLEFHRDRGSLRSLARMVPLAVGAVVSVLLLIPVQFYYPYTSPLLSRAMSTFSLIVAVCGLICRYKSRLAAVLIFIGGLVLAFFWLLNRVLV